MRMLIAYTLIACGSLTAQQTPKDESPATTALEKLRADLFGAMNPRVTSLAKQQVAGDIMKQRKLTTDQSVLPTAALPGTTELRVEKNLNL